MTSGRCHDDFDVIITLAITNVSRLSDIKRCGDYPVFLLGGIGPEKSSQATLNLKVQLY